MVVGWSRRRLQIGTHDVRHSADFGGLPEFVESRFALLQAITQCFDRDIDTDFVAILEAVGHGLGGRVDAKGDPFDNVLLNPGLEGDPGKADDPQGREVGSWQARLLVDRHPNFERSLCRQFVKLERREQANDPARDATAGFDQRALLTGIIVLKNVQPATQPIEDTLGVELVEVRTRDPDSLHVLGAQDASLLKQTQNLVSLGRGQLMTQCRGKVTTPDTM